MYEIFILIFPLTMGACGSKKVTKRVAKQLHMASMWVSQLRRWPPACCLLVKLMNIFSFFETILLD